MELKEVEEIIRCLSQTEQLMPRRNDVVADKDVILRLEAIPNIDISDRYGRTLLSYSVIYDRPNVVSYLINRGADVNSVDKQLFTPLHFAAKAGNVKTIILLLDAGANINARNAFGNIPLMLCNNATDFGVYEMLLSRGSDAFLKNNYGLSAADIFATSTKVFELIHRIHSEKTGDGLRKP